jgi:hypothetical protein
MRNSVVFSAPAGFGQVLPAVIVEFLGSVSWTIHYPVELSNSLEFVGLMRAPATNSIASSLWTKSAWSVNTSLLAS